MSGRGGLSDLFRSSAAIRVAALAFACLAFFYLGRHWSAETPFGVAFYNSTDSVGSRWSEPVPVANVSVNPDANSSSAAHPTPPPAPAPGPGRVGVVDANGTMWGDFADAGDADLDLGEEGVEKEGSREAGDGGGGDADYGGGAGSDDDVDAGADGNVSGTRNVNAAAPAEAAAGGTTVKVGNFQVCPESMKEFIPCLDNADEINRLTSIERGEKYERHCPAPGKGLNCLVPAPKDYKTPIPWPRSRDEVWYSNVPHTRLVDDKGGQNWITRDGDKFKFPGGGTQFIHGADQYIDKISQMVPDIAFGNRTRVVLDVGCGVASFGASLLSRDVITLSIAPKDVHENQIQFALERGVPAMVAAFATRRLLYPSQAFDLIHCSRCRINWTRDDGILLLEVNRLLRAGGYFVWAAQPVYKHEEAQQEAWKEMEDLTARICWELVNKQGYIAIWRKPLNNTCYSSRDAGVRPPLCTAGDDPDKTWYVDLKPCISRLPDNGYGSNITSWPSRLHSPPSRLQSIEIDAFMAKKELFRAESLYWNHVIEGYVNIFRWKDMNLRNVMDMSAGFGGFAAALLDYKIDSWVLNVVPTSEPNTLPVIYDRGLVGVAHDWCEPFDSYPRTYDLLHAAGVFSREHKRCSITNILLEMDRLLRPGGRAYIRDNILIIHDIKEIVEAMGWRTDLRDTSEGSNDRLRVLMCDKILLTS